MVGRTLTAPMVTALESNVIRPCLMARFDIVDDPLIAWTGPGIFTPTGTGDAALDGEVFVPSAPYVDMGDITEDQGIGSPLQMVVAGHDLDEELLLQVVNDKRQWRGRRAWLWLALLNVDEATVIADPVRIKTGVMTQMTVDRKPTDHTVTITIDKDLGRARSAPWRWLDHQRIFPADLWSSFILALANKPEGFTDSPLRDRAGLDGPVTPPPGPDDPQLP